MLSILKQRSLYLNSEASITKAFRDLNVFVAGIQKGSIVSKGDPIYALLSKATETIQKLLDSFHSGFAKDGPETMSFDKNGIDDWTVGQDLYDFETGFWESLADHPSLVTSEVSTFQDL